jgi:transposase-like protein
MSSKKVEKEKEEKGEKEKGILAKPEAISAVGQRILGQGEVRGGGQRKASQQPASSAAGRHVLDVFCPYCESKNFVRRGTRKNKFQTVQLFLCRNPECGKTFTQSDVKGKKFPLNVIVAGITLYNQGYTLEQCCNALKEKYKINPDVDTLASWYEEYKPLCRFERMRPYALKMYRAKDMIEEVTMAHRQLYRFRYHRAKIRLMLEEFGNRNLWRMKDYLDAVTSETPHQYFQDGERMSEVRSKFSTADMIVKSKFNFANKLAGFVLQAVTENKLRHEALQKFMLANDSVTVATEVPVYIRREDVEYMENVLKFKVVGEEGFILKGKKVSALQQKAISGSGTARSAQAGLPRLLTGHVDIIQIRNHCVHLLDYKPNAAKERPIEQLTWYALALSRLTGLRLFEFKCGWFDEKDYFEFFPLHVVKKLKGPSAQRKGNFRHGDAKKPRRRMVQFKDGTKVEVPRENQRKVVIV